MCDHPDHYKSNMRCFRCDEFICPECAVYAEYEMWPDGFFDRLVCSTHFKKRKGIMEIPAKEKNKFWETWTAKWSKDNGQVSG